MARPWGGALVTSAALNVGGSGVDSEAPILPLTSGYCRQIVSDVNAAQLNRPVSTSAPLFFDYKILD